MNIYIYTHTHFFLYMLFLFMGVRWGLLFPLLFRVSVGRARGVGVSGLGRRVQVKS